MKKLALIGASSSIGRRLAPYLATHLTTWDVIKTCYANTLEDAESLDIRDNNALSRFIQKNNPDVLIWLAGTKDVQKCQNNYNFAYELNTQPIIDLCSILKSVKPAPHIIFISTDYVFDGSIGHYTDSSTPMPTTNYGETNYLAERALRSSFLPWTVIRTAAIVGKGFNYFDWLTHSLLSGERVESYADSTFTPTPILLFNKAMATLINHPAANDIFHVVGNVAMSRYEFSLKIAQILGRANQIVPVQRPKDNVFFQKNLSLAPSKMMESLQRTPLEFLIKEELLAYVKN